MSKMTVCAARAYWVKIMAILNHDPKVNKPCPPEASGTKQIETPPGKKYSM